MKPDRDPVRLADPRSDAPASLREALRAAEDDLPSPNKLAELMAKGPSGSPPSGSPPSGSGAPPPKGAPGLPATPAYPSILPGILAGAALGLVGGAAVWLLSGPPDAPPPARVEVVAASAPPVEEHAAPPQEAVHPTPPPPQSASSSQKTGSERGRPLLPPSGGDRSEATAATEATAAAEAAPPPSPETANEAAKESELSLLRRAQSQLSASPSAALALANEHAARFPGGLFSQEREVIAVTALAGMGRSAEAEARARRFLSVHPTSAHRRRMEAIVPALKNEAGDQKTTEPAPSTPGPH